MSVTFKVFAAAGTRFIEETADKLEAVEHCKSLHNADPEEYHEVYRYIDGKEASGVFQLKPDSIERKRREWTKQRDAEIYAQLKEAKKMEKKNMANKCPKCGAPIHVDDDSDSHYEHCTKCDWSYVYVQWAD